MKLHSNFKRAYSLSINKFLPQGLLNYLAPSADVGYMRLRHLLRDVFSHRKFWIAFWIIQVKRHFHCLSSLAKNMVKALFHDYLSDFTHQLLRWWKWQLDSRI
jgi:hypothetical protein